MTESVSKTCRICLEQQDEHDQFHILNNNNDSILLSKLLDLVPEIDLDFVKNPISCNQCTITINRIHEFKNLCVKTESVVIKLKQERKSIDDAISYVKNETEIQMIKEEFFEETFKDEYTINMAERVLKICRICLEQLGENKHFHFLNNNNGSMLLSKLMNFLPEIDLDFVKNPISCNRCTIIINQVYEFKKLCMQAEAIIKDLKTQRKSFDEVSLVKKVTEIKPIKEEFLKDKFKDEPLIVDDVCLQINTDLPVCIEVPTKLLFYCYTCDYTTYHKKYLARHLNIHRLQVRRFRCNQCSYSTPKSSSLTAHKQSHLKIRPYQCNICDNSYVRKAKLNVHLKSHTGEKPYKCDVCDYRCVRKDHLKLHLRIHTGDKPYKCNVCDYCCNYKSNLTVHMLTHTIEKPYKCDVCDKSYVQEDKLEVHLKSHTGEKRYKCDICDYSSFRKDHLKTHLRMHTGDIPYKCKECNYCAIYKSELIRHIHTHTREKPYKCDVCNNSYARKDRLKLHLRMHSGDKLYKCNECNYCAIYKSQLIRHIHTHTGEKPYKCDVCNNSYARKDCLKLHLRSHT